MSDIKHCPECGTELHEAKGIAIYCPNNDCPVADDPDLWDGKGNRKEVKINWGKSFETSNELVNRLREENQQLQEECNTLREQVVKEASVVEGLMEQCSVQQHAKEELVKEFNELDKENQQLREQVEKGEEAFKLQWFIYKDLEQEAIELKDQLSKYQGVVDAAEKVSKRYSGDGIPELCESLQRLKESEK